MNQTLFQMNNTISPKWETENNFEHNIYRTVNKY